MMEKRLNIRLSQADYDRLQDIRLATFIGSDSDVIRTLIQARHRELAGQIRRVKAIAKQDGGKRGKAR